MTDQPSDAALQALFADFERLGAHELHLRTSGFELHLSRDIAAPSILPSAAGATAGIERLAPAPASPSATPGPPVATRSSADIPAGAAVVAAPNLGTFYRAPKPGADPYVEVGDTVREGDELCLIEVMKLFTAVAATMGGRIVAVLAEDGAMVEAGAPLFAIEPA